MNATTRKTLSALTSRLEEMHAECDDIAQTLDDMVDACEERFDNMTDTRQASDAGQELASELSDLRDAKEAMEAYHVSDALDALGSFSL